ncbi:DegQ family serine endoprotease [Methylocella sp. CPCC 101449]|uniref:DegQ family serine endoprotease n=1 Tax=Methylocella sp. CPCC 101449 TaxID=2987531 RepID=UPI002890EC1D|nr:DegQ family serine endoprotease [Methylocella sp. CPCC 101449]MDT2022744.1 DegQ family serine endoprotease [Methylocella sp. CPCC 101449]
MLLRLAVLLSLPLIVVPALAQAPVPAPTRQVPESRQQLVLSYAPIVKRTVPAVVNVYASRTEKPSSNPLFDDPFFRQFFGQGGRPQTQQSLGSGVIVDQEGLVVTNNHVIEGMTDVKVALSDRREIDAEIVLRDPRTDLAILRLKSGKDFPALDMGDSDALEVGDVVLAVGNPFAVGQTVTQGIVSGLARTQVGITDYGFFIQTDAAINPGNSGGALVDMEGRLVGINSAIYSRSGGSVGIGFAIPVNMVKVVLATAKGGGRQVRRPWLGATLQSVSREIAESIGLDRPTGALVADVIGKSAAEAAGLKRGDVIVSLDNQPVVDPESLGFRLGTKSVGGTASLSILRGGKPLVLPLKLQVAPEDPPREEVKIGPGRSPFVGATLVNYSPAIGEEFSVHGVREGVVVIDVEDGSNAQSLGLQKGDVVVSINDVKMLRTKDMQSATSQRRLFWQITIGRGGQLFTTVINGG